MTNLMLPVVMLLAQSGGVLVGPDPRPGPMPGTNATLETPHQSAMQEKACLDRAEARAQAQSRRVTLAEQKQCAAGTEAEVEFR
ncbi:MAG: hypothetical protein ABIR63_03925 [Sphingomicrobium sp.]